MQRLIDQLKGMSSAEDFLQYFAVPYDERVVRVNRLHILKRFHQYLNRGEGLHELDEVAMFRSYRELLTRAYEDFVTSSAQREKVFKVFQDTDGTQHVNLSSLRDSLSERRRAAA